MKFFESKYQSLIVRKIPMFIIAINLYEDGYRQTSSNKAILTNSNGDILTECGHALVKAVRKLERKNENQCQV